MVMPLLPHALECMAPIDIDKLDDLSDAFDTQLSY